MKRIPTLGYPSKAEAARALHNDGLKPAEIARVAGMPGGQVYAAIRKGIPASIDGQEFRMVPIPTKALMSLRKAADRRGVSVNTLARLILCQVASDNLAEAIMDDGKTREAAD